jgi:TPR repeat protein
MNNLFRVVFTALLLSLTLTIVPTAAEEFSTGAHYADEQALVAKLSKSTVVDDQRRLAAMLSDGLIASAENPLRRVDRDGAIAAYRRARELGDQSAGTTVALARLLLRDDKNSGFAELIAPLRNFMMQGNGDAAYILALDAAQNKRLPKDKTIPMLQAAAVMGNISAVLDLAGGNSAMVGDTVKGALLDGLEQKARNGATPAAFALYQIYNDNKFVTRDPQKAIGWLTLAVAGGHVSAIERYAAHLQFGTDMPANPGQALSLYRQAAQAGSGIAAMALGRDIRSHTPIGVGVDESRTWLRRAAEIGIRGATIEIVGLDLNLALKEANADQKARMVEAALQPIANDAAALSDLANRHWQTNASSAIGPVLRPLLERQALAGSATAGLAYDAWLKIDGERLPEPVATALIKSLRQSPPGSAGFANFTIADLALDKRVSPSVVPQVEAMKLLFDAADADVGQAMLRLGQMYAHGDQLARSPAFAQRWFERAQQQAVERASWDLAEMQIGSDDPQQQDVGERFYLKKLDEGDPRAALALADHRLKTGNLDDSTLAQARSVAADPHDATALAKILMASGTAESLEAAGLILRPLADEKSEPEALIAFGKLLIMQAKSADDARHGFDVLNLATVSGRVDAKVALASAYLSSAVYADKRGDAISLLNNALAESPRDADAKLVMSRAYLLGLGVKRDPVKAAELIGSIRDVGEYEVPKASLLEADWLAYSSSRRNPETAIAILAAQAAQGSAAAEQALGQTYLSGFGVALDPDLAAGYLYTAAHDGDKAAMAAFGHLMLNGYGISQSEQGGLAWLDHAADAGSTSAMYELSRIYALGSVGGVDEKLAIDWLQRAAARNHPNAAYELGLAYLKGEWVPADTNQAAIWFERSANAGSLLAGRTLEIVKRQIAVGEPPDASGASDE